MRAAHAQLLVVSLGAGRGEGALALCHFLAERQKAAVVAHPGCRMAVSCLCVEHGFPNTTE